MTNMDKLYASVAANGPVCVGLDTEFSYLPADVVDCTKTAGENVVEFNRRIIEATKASAGCYKVQIAYYESLGLDGMRAYAETLKMVRATGLPVIADIKRGDIAKTAEMYAKAHFTGDFEADIITLAPYMGLDSISPYLPYCKEQGKGLFVLCRTSNPGAKDFEYKKLEDGRHVYDLVGDSLSELGRDYIGESGYSSIGLVIGGTHTEEAACITHGGVIMNMMANHVLPQHKPEEWMTDPGCGYSLRLDAEMWMRDHIAEAFDIVPYGYLDGAEE